MDRLSWRVQSIVIFFSVFFPSTLVGGFSLSDNKFIKVSRILLKNLQILTIFDCLRCFCFFLWFPIPLIFFQLFKDRSKDSKYNWYHRHLRASHLFLANWYYNYLFLENFFTLALHMAIPSSLTDSKFPKISKTLLIILGDLSNSAVCMVSILPPISNCS